MLKIFDCQKSIITLYLNKGDHLYLAMKFQELSRTFQGVFQEIFMLNRHFMISFYKEHDLF